MCLINEDACRLAILFLLETPVGHTHTAVAFSSPPTWMSNAVYNSTSRTIVVGSHTGREGVLDGGFIERMDGRGIISYLLRGLLIHNFRRSDRWFERDGAKCGRSLQTPVDCLASKTGALLYGLQRLHSYQDCHGAESESFELKAAFSFRATVHQTGFW